MTSYKYDAIAASVPWEDEAQRAEFLVRAEEYDLTTVERYLSVMNKPSQFVGRVSTFEEAQKHWEDWDRYVAEHAEENPSADDDPKPRGRPSAKKRDRLAIERAQEEWHKAVAGRKQAKLDTTAWQQREIAAIKARAIALMDDWDNFVLSKKEELSKLQNNN